MSQSPPPPPPPGGYGSPPPPPPAGGYGGPPPAGSSGWSVGNAVSYGWAKFQANVGQIIIAGLIALVGIAIFIGVGVVIRGILVQEPECTSTSLTVTCEEGSGFIAQLFANAIINFLFFLAYQIIGAGIIRGSLAITEGRPFEFSELFKTDKLGPVVVTSLITGAIIFVGTLLCFLPGIIAAFMLSYSLYFVVDRNMAPMEAITASFNLVKNNLGEALVWAIVSYVIVIVGAILCGVGLIVAIPVSIIGTAFTYKLLTGQQVAA